MQGSPGSSRPTRGIACRPAVAESGTLARLALLVALIWDILIKGRIYGASMQLGRLQANLLSITIWVIVLLLSNAFMPAPMPEQAPQNPAVEQVQPPSN